MATHLPRLSTARCACSLGCAIPAILLAVSVVRLNPDRSLAYWNKNQMIFICENLPVRFFLVSLCACCTTTICKHGNIGLVLLTPYSLTLCI